jgi:hypothetical protein
MESFLNKPATSDEPQSDPASVFAVSRVSVKLPAELGPAAWNEIALQMRGSTPRNLPVAGASAGASSRRHDDALLVWLASQPDGQPHRNDFEIKTMREDQATDEPAAFLVNAAGEVLGTLSVFGTLPVEE